MEAMTKEKRKLGLPEMESPSIALAMAMKASARGTRFQCGGSNGAFQKSPHVYRFLGLETVELW